MQIMGRTLQQKRKVKVHVKKKDPEDTKKKICEDGDAGEACEGVEGGGFDGSSDDEAPDAIPLSEGKHIAMETMKSVSDEVKRTRDKKKHKRRQAHDLFKKQKEAKQLKKLAKFPEKSLEEVARKITEEKTTKKSSKLKPKEKHEQGSEKEEVSSDVEKVGGGGGGGGGGIKLVTLDVEESGIGPAVSYEAASSFLQQQLFGGRHKRIPALSQQAKRYHNKPAKNFATSNQSQST